MPAYFHLKAGISSLQHRIKFCDGCEWQQNCIDKK